MPRRAAVEDAGEIARLARELGYPSTGAQMRARLERLGTQAHHCVLVLPGPEPALLGWLHAVRQLVLESGESIEILGLVVDARARRGGLGRMLVQAAEQWGRDCGVGRILVRSNAVRTEAHQFYPALGYTRTKTQHVYLKPLP